jgi:hypothetical protein
MRGASRVLAVKDIKASYRDGAGADITPLSWLFV